MPRLRVFGGLLAIGWAALGGFAPAWAGDASSDLRFEARSADLLAVGIVRDDRLTLRLSQIVDNAPVHDAAVNVRLRGLEHPAVAESDGSYSLRSPDLRLPGTAALELDVIRTGGHEQLHAVLDNSGDASGASAAAAPAEHNSVRQLGWWVLNFAVCIGFLMLWSRRRKAVRDRSGDAD